MYSGAGCEEKAAAKLLDQREEAKTRRLYAPSSRVHGELPLVVHPIAENPIKG